MERSYSVYSGGPDSGTYQITIKKMAKPTSKAVYDYLYGYESDVAAYLDIERYKNHIKSNKRHATFEQNLSVPTRTPKKAIRAAGDRISTAKFRRSSPSCSGNARVKKQRGEDKKYVAHVLEKSLLNQPPLSRDVWDTWGNLCRAMQESDIYV